MKNLAWIGLGAVSAGLLAFATAATSCNNTPAPRPTCDAIGELCHDSTTTEGQDCHETAENETTTEEQCKTMEANCTALCAEGGSGGTGGTSGGGSGGAGGSTGGAGGSGG